MRRAFKITSTEKLVELKIKHVLRPYMSLIELLDLETELDERPLEEVAQAYFKLGYR